MKWLLTAGIILLILGGALVLLPSDIFNQLADSVGMSTTTYNSTSLVHRQLVQIPPSNYNFSLSLRKGLTLTGNFTVITGGAVSILGFDRAGYSQWSSTSSGVPVFYTYPPSENGTFYYKVEKDDVYYVVLVSKEHDKSIVLTSIILMEEQRNPSLVALMLGPIMLALGAIVVLFRIQPDFIAPKIQRREQEIERAKATIRVAKALGIPIQGKSLDQVRKEIKEYMDKERASPQ
ncbi:MAG: hypothetical protein ACUVQ8_04115 [Nitrososphaeria archaeon]